MNEHGNVERGQSYITEDTLRSIAKGYHLEKFGEDLVLAAQDKRFLLRWINSDSEDMQIFILCHLDSWAFDDDIIFVRFCKNCLASESSLDLKVAAIMYLSRVFAKTANYELLFFLRQVLSDTLSSAKTLPPPKSEAARKLSLFIYASIMIDLDRSSEISPNLVLNEHVLDELDRALASRIGDADEGKGWT